MASEELLRISAVLDAQAQAADESAPLHGFLRMSSMLCDAMSQILAALPAARTAAPTVQEALGYPFFRELAFGVHGAVPRRAAHLLSAYAATVLKVTDSLPQELGRVAASRHELAVNLAMQARSMDEAKGFREG